MLDLSKILKIMAAQEVASLASGNKTQPASKPANQQTEHIFAQLSQVLGTGGTSQTAQATELATAASALSQEVRALMAKADLLESLLNLSPIPEHIDVSDLLKEMRKIIANLDLEVRQLYQEMEDNKDKAEYRLKPTALHDMPKGEEEGFDKSLIIEVR